jgi:hypothetical protein
MDLRANLHARHASMLIRLPVNSNHPHIKEQIVQRFAAVRYKNKNYVLQ